jgi:phosphotriesterase-related protein
MENLIFRTVLGDIPVSELGMILPHEHLFTDLRGPDTVDYAQDDPNMVIDTMRPYLAAAEDAGVTALIECSTVGVGRNIEILRRLAEQTRIHIIAPTGIYKEAFTPEAYLNHTIDDLVKLWTQEITHAIDETTSKAGFIKIAVSDDGSNQVGRTQHSSGCPNEPNHRCCHCQSHHWWTGCVGRNRFTCR